MRSTVTLLLVSLLVISCATKPATFDFNPVANLEGDYDKAWSAVVEYFAVGSLPIQTIEKDSGIIVTTWMDAGVGYIENKEICDCGGAGMSTVRWTRGKFNVFVQESGAGVDVRVTCTFQQSRIFMGETVLVDCNSTGAMEENVHGYVRAKLMGDRVEPPPTFKPGSTDA